MPPRPIVLIVGPTAAGKTELAVGLASRLPGGGECICADSMQVYRGLDAGTAKPTVAQRRAVPHHLIDVADPAHDAFTVDAWLELAERAIAEIRARGKWPIVVGGTNLYVQALLYGMCKSSEPDPELRRALAERPGNDLRRWLERVDPVAAGRIHPNDRRRTVRAIEVHEGSGLRLGTLQEQWRPGAERRDVLIIGLEYPVEVINHRINARVRQMMEAGLLEETDALHRAGRLGPQAREALGYRQLIDHLEGRLDLEAAVEQIKIRTRRFAKQQRTWLRRFRALPRSAWLKAGQASPQELLEQALTFIDGLAAAPPPPAA
jgi:tRNA dimethylallyltransferase